MPHNITRRSLMLACAALAVPGQLLAGAKPLGVGFQAREWKISEIAGTPVSEGIEATIIFEMDGRYGGRVCNRFTGSYEVDGDRLRLGLAAATRMACEKPLMAHESAFFGVLDKVASWRVGEDGALTLTDKDGAPLLVAKRVPQ